MLNQVITRAQKDTSFRDKLLADPMGTLRAAGCALPPGLQVKALENTSELYYLVLPPRKKALTVEMLDKVTAGTNELPVRDPFTDTPLAPSTQRHP